MSNAPQAEITPQTSIVTQNSKVVVYEYEEVTGTKTTYYYHTTSQTPAGMTPSGRAFQLFQNDGDHRIPVYTGFFTPSQTIGRCPVLTAAVDPSTFPGVSPRQPGQNPLGYVSTNSGNGRKQLHQHWGRSNDPYVYRYDTEPTLSGYAENTKINNETAFVPEVQSFKVVTQGTSARIEDSSGAEVTEITVYAGYGNLIRFYTDQVDLTFATLSLYKVDAENKITDFDGKFYIDRWTPQEVFLVDDNTLNSGEKTYDFLLTMRSGTTYYDHDPKIKNRGASGLG